MSVHSRPSIQYQDGMELRNREMTKDCTQPLRNGNIRALNGCAGRLFGAATLHNHKNSANKSNVNKTLLIKPQIDTIQREDMVNQGKAFSQSEFLHLLGGFSYAESK